MLLGDDLSRKEEIINALNSTKPIYFSYSKDNTEYIQYYKCKKENNFFLDINIVDYIDFAFSNFEITNQEDYDFSVCYLNNELLKQISIVKFEYKDATDEDAFFSKYQHLYACDILILAEKTKIEFQKDKAAKENIHSCSIYNYITDIETSIRKLNDIKTRKNICSTVAMGGEDINETDFINLKTGLYNEIISYYELDNKHSINWITNYINRINTILNQVIAEKEIKNQSSELLNKEFESILKTLNISNSLNESIFAEFDLHKIDKGAKELIETISENQNNKEKSSYDCSQLKKLFALDIEFIFGYYHSFIKQNLSESYLLRCTEILRILNSKLRDFSNLNYFLLMLDIVKSISTQINQNEGKVEHAPSDYSMNHGVLTIENIVNYISYQVLSIYNSKAFKLAEKVKFYHRTDPYLSKIKKIVKRIKETDIENESETKIVNQKIEDAFMHIKNLFDECMNNFSYFINNPEEKSILKDFISINKEILKYPDLSGECNPHFQRD